MDALHAAFQHTSKAEVLRLYILAHAIYSFLHGIDDAGLTVNFFIVFLKCYIVLQLEALIRFILGLTQNLVVDSFVVLEGHSDVELILVGVILAARVRRLVEEALALLAVNWTSLTQFFGPPPLHLVLIVDEDAAFFESSQLQVFRCFRVQF